MENHETSNNEITKKISNEILKKGIEKYYNLMTNIEKTQGISYTKTEIKGKRRHRWKK